MKVPRQNCLEFLRRPTRIRPVVLYDTNQFLGYIGRKIAFRARCRDRQGRNGLGLVICRFYCMGRRFGFAQTGSELGEGVLFAPLQAVGD